MKKVFSITLPLMLLFVTSRISAQDEEKNRRERYENFKERNLTKTFSASGNSLHVENKFGNVKVVTSKSNEIKVDIHIEVSSTDKSYTDKRFDLIDIEEKKDGNKISLTTLLNKNKEKEKEDNIGCKNCKNTIIIDYNIQIPEGNELIIVNSFGDVILPDYNGPVSVTSKFGSFTSGKLAKPGTISVEFGKADLKSISNVDMTGKFSTVMIGGLGGNSKLNLSFCSYSKINLDASLSGLTVNDSYSTVHLDPATNLSANYIINTSFGNFIDKTNLDFKRTDTHSKYGSDMKKSYEGKSGSGSIKIDIKSSFGNIMIGKGTKEDIEPKHKVIS